MRAPTTDDEVATTASSAVVVFSASVVVFLFGKERPPTADGVAIIVGFDDDGDAPVAEELPPLATFFFSPPCWDGDCPFMPPPAVAAIPLHHRLRLHPAALLERPPALAPPSQTHSCARSLSPHPPPAVDAGLAYRMAYRAKHQNTCPKIRI